MAGIFWPLMNDQGGDKPQRGGGLSDGIVRTLALGDSFLKTPRAVSKAAGTGQIDREPNDQIGGSATGFE